MYYHFAILLLFRPFIKLEMTGSSISPRDVCNQAADAIAALVNSYSQLYTLRRTPSFVSYFVLTSSITHLVALGVSGGGLERVQQGISDLKVMAGCHSFARRAQDILTFLAYQWEIELPAADDEEDKAENKKDPKTLGRPRTKSTNLFALNFEMKDIIDGIKPGKNNESPLFCPFPMQGRPMIDDIVNLEIAGFRLLNLDGAGKDVKMEE
jgi:hypothetical protein